MFIFIGVNKKMAKYRLSYINLNYQDRKIITIDKLSSDGTLHRIRTCEQKPGDCCGYGGLETHHILFGLLYS